MLGIIPLYLKTPPINAELFINLLFYKIKSTLLIIIEPP